MMKNTDTKVDDFGLELGEASQSRSPRSPGSPRLRRRSTMQFRKPSFDIQEELTRLPRANSESRIDLSRRDSVSTVDLSLGADGEEEEEDTRHSGYDDLYDFYSAQESTFSLRERLRDYLHTSKLDRVIDYLQVFLSLASCVMYVIQTYDINDDKRETMALVEAVFCIFFALDYFLSLYIAENRAKYIVRFVSCCCICFCEDRLLNLSVIACTPFWMW